MARLTDRDKEARRKLKLVKATKIAALINRGRVSDKDAQRVKKSMGD